MAAASRKEFSNLLASGVMRVDPSPSEIRGASIVLTLSDRVFKAELGATSVVDVNSPMTYPKLEAVHIDSNGVVIEPGEFLLSSTRETLAMPTTHFGILSNISGLARLGLQVVLSNHVAPGFGAREPKSIALELVNHSRLRLRLHASMRICHLTLVSLDSDVKAGYDVTQNRYGNSTSPSSQFGKP